jgi:hypothetical protein
MTSTTNTTSTTTSTAGHARHDVGGERGLRRIALASGVVGTAAGILLVAVDPARGSTGPEVTASLVASVTPVQVLAGVAVLAGAGLTVAAVRLGSLVTGLTGRVASGAGIGVALLLTAYLGTFASGALVGHLLLTDRGPGIGESTLVVLNVVEFARYAASLALVAAALTAGDRLPRPTRVAAGILAVALVVPLSQWVAVIVVPLWLGIAGSRSRR